MRSPNRSDARRAAEAGDPDAYRSRYRPYSVSADWHHGEPRGYVYGAARSAWARRALAVAFAEHGPAPEDLQPDDDEGSATR